MLCASKKFIWVRMLYYMSYDVCMLLFSPYKNLHAPLKFAILMRFDSQKVQAIIF